MPDPFEQRLSQLDSETQVLFDYKLRHCPVEDAFDLLLLSRLPDLTMAEVVAYKQRCYPPVATPKSQPPDPASRTEHRSPEPSTINPEPSTAQRAHPPMSHPRNGRIARLPENIRNEINEMLDKDIEYRRIIDVLQSKGYSGINFYHISRWKDGGYLDHRQHQERCEELEMRRKWAEELAQQCPGDNFEEACKKAAHGSLL